MRINDIRIENFKGFEVNEFSFNDKFTVFIGDNGAGKSGILDAVSIAIGTILLKTGASFGRNGQKSRPLQKNEIRKVIVSDNNIELSKVVLSGAFENNNQVLEWKREQPTNSQSLSIKYAKSLTEVGLMISRHLKENIDLPLIAYHSTARLAGQIHGKTVYEKTGSRLDGYYACLDPRSINDKFLSWFKTYEDSVLKFNKDKTLYNAFSEAVVSVVPDWSEIKFHWGLDDIIGKQSDGMWLPLSDLSDGYRTIIGLVADLAYRAIKLNPHLGADAVKQTKGIVLIDEIDMHLHPNWQKRIIGDLRQAFPNVQFIATTHSPFIVQSLKSNEVINLDSKLINENPDTLSIADNALLMGVKSEMSEDFSIKEEIALSYLTLLDSEPTDAVLTKLNELIASTTDPAFKAKLIIERLSKFGK
jgi:predicted ATP-binding protein involved in virulence